MLAKSSRLLLLLWFVALAVVGGFYSCGDNTIPPAPKKDTGVDQPYVPDGNPADVFVDAVTSDYGSADYK